MQANNRVALITGCSSGFGLLAAVTMAKAGFQFFATMRNLKKRQKLDDAARQAGVNLNVLALDVNKKTTITQSLKKIHKAAGPIDVLVNNAGFAFAGFVEDVSDSELRSQFDTNFFAAAELMRQVIPAMRERKQGHIINISSIAGRVGNPAISSYAASKWALEGLSESLSNEMAPFNVKVSLVEPGQFPTEIFSGFPMAKKSQSESSAYYTFGRYLEGLIMKRLAGNKADPQVVADLITKIALKKNPRLRYPVGWDARAQIYLRRVLPARWIELLTNKVVRTLWNKSQQKQ